MRIIISELITIIQYFIAFINIKSYIKHDSCPYCNSNALWRHGVYHRKPTGHRSQENIKEKVPIQRYMCSKCKRTYSVLPECIPPNRWYMWDMQQHVLKMLISVSSINSISKNTKISRSTIKRWLQTLESKHVLYKSILVCEDTNLARFDTVLTFWEYWLKNHSLSKAYYLLNFHKIPIP